MAGCRDLSEAVASLAVDDPTARMKPPVRGRARGAKDNARENVTTQPRQALCQNYVGPLTVSSNKNTMITGMYLTANNKLWVKYRPPGAHMDYLKLFGDDGKELGLWRGRVVPEGLSLTCVEDTLLSLESWRWIKPSGESGCLDKAPNRWARCSKTISPPYVILSYVTPNNTQDIGYSLYRLQVLSVDPLTVELVTMCHLDSNYVSNSIGFDVSSCETMLCVVNNQSVEIFCIDDPWNSPTVSHQVTGSRFNIDLKQHLEGRIVYSIPNSSIEEYHIHFTDACFCSQRGRDILIASTTCSCKVRKTAHGGNISISNEVLYTVPILDHDDGFLVKMAIPTKVYCSCVTAHGPGGRVWIGCGGGQILVKTL